ncbi:MAG: HD domain-containing protein [Geminicoccaceae bacterium]
MILEREGLGVWEERLAGLLAAHADGDGSHGLHHSRRVWANARKIASREAQPVDGEVLVAAAFLHDLVNPPKNAPDRARASLLSADRAVDLLRTHGFAASKLDAVHHAIHAHSFSAAIEPQTIEAKILQDADRLESLGAIGLARTFYVAGRMDSELFDPEDLMAKHRPLDDKRFAIDHFQTKLLKLPALLNTEAAKAIADERVAFLRRFLAQLQEELCP